MARFRDQPIRDPPIRDPPSRDPRNRKPRIQRSGRNKSRQLLRAFAELSGVSRVVNEGATFESLVSGRFVIVTPFDTTI
ncbi:MAG: hypothetical protein ABI120_01330 [Gemmatimonadaceae bacterium]